MTRAAGFLGFLAVAVVGAELAAAETSSFNTPSVRGVRLDVCRHFGRDCGKPAADLFCRENGFAEAQRFVVDQNIGARGIKTLVFGDGRICDGPQCSGFRVILCTRSVEAAPVAKPPTLVVKPIKPPPTVAVKPVRPVPPPTKAGKPPAIAPLDGPLFAMPAGASLVRCTTGTCEFSVTHDFDIDPKEAEQSEYFIGNVDKIDFANGFRWQVATVPFPPFKSGAASDLKPPGLAGSGEVAGKDKGFNVDFKEIVGGLKVRTKAPPSLYIRILPITKPGSDVVVGQPSNSMRIYYAAVPPAQQPIRIYDASPPQLFRVKVVSFTPPDFEKPSRWGCVVVKGYKGPDVGFATQILKDVYPVGKELCPKSFKGGSGQITSVREFVDWATGGVTDGLDWVSDRYEDLKQIAVDVVMKYTPFGLQCDAIGELIDEDAPGYCEVAAKIAVNAGLAALGVPPSIPNYNELIDQGVDHAVEMAVAEIAAQTGYPCIGPCEDALRKGFDKVAENLKTSSYTPGCVGTEQAHQNGREPLCIPDTVIAKPAKGAVYSPPVAIVEVTRNFADKDPENIFDQKCSLGVGIRFENFFAGETVWGPGTSPKTKKVPAQAIDGNLFTGSGQELSPSMKKGSKLTKTVIFETPQKFIFPWTKELWSRSQIPARDEQGPMGPDWFTLYSGATAKVKASINCAKEGHTLAYKLPAL